MASCDILGITPFTTMKESFDETTGMPLIAFATK